MVDDPVTLQIEFSTLTAAQADLDAEELAGAIRRLHVANRVDRVRISEHTLDLGPVLSVILAGPATLALIKGLIAWMRAREGGEIVVTGPHGKATIKGGPTASVDVVALAKAMQGFSKTT